MERETAHADPPVDAATEAAGAAVGLLQARAKALRSNGFEANSSFGAGSSLLTASSAVVQTKEPELAIFAGAWMCIRGSASAGMRSISENGSSATVQDVCGATWFGTVSGNALTYTEPDEVDGVRCLLFQAGSRLTCSNGETCGRQLAEPAGAREEDVAAFDPRLVGSWAYDEGGMQYEIVPSDNGGLRFQQSLGTAHLSGELKRRGPWLEAALCTEDTGNGMTIRMRMQEGSNSTMLVANRHITQLDWNAEYVAHRGEEQRTTGIPMSLVIVIIVAAMACFSMCFLRSGGDAVKG